jgi:hypothetical protein
MLRVSVIAGLRRQVWLLLAVVVIALSMLAMHQLSSNHAVAGTDAASSGLVSAALAGPGSHHLIDGQAPRSSRLVGHTHSRAVDAHGLDGHPHGQQVSVAVPDHPVDDRDCPDCGHHQAMALTCLAALIVIMVGWVVARPAAWRGVRLPRLTVTAALAQAPPVRLRALSLEELSVSRT